MQYKLTKLEERALRNTHAVNSIRRKGGDTLRTQAVREEERYRSYIGSRKVSA